MVALRRLLASAGLSWLLLAVGLAGCPGGSPPIAHPPHILLITVDTLRADHLGMYGYSRNASPNIDRWFADALVFERAYATETSTSPSIASILTGRLPQTHRVRLHYQLLPASIPTIADALGAAGYQTAAVVSNIVLTTEAMGLGVRFEYYDDFVDEPEPRRNIWERNARRTTDAALHWLHSERDSERLHLLWIHYMDPHGPYAAPQDRPRDFQHPSPQPFDLGRMLRFQIDPGVDDALEYLDRYDEEIAYCDREIGRLLDEYESLGLAPSAVIVLVADHGETMDEHEYWFTHQYQVYEPIARVPLAIRVPGRDGARIEAPVSLVDLAPTILELADVPIPEGMDGRSLLSKGPLTDVFVEATAFRGGLQHRALVRGETKLIVDVDRDTGRERGRYRFDLARDSAELEPLPWRPEDEEAATALIDRIANDPDPGGRPLEFEQGTLLTAPKVRPGTSEEDLEKLRSLGYVE